MARILVVEDDVDVREVLTLLFEDAGHEVSSARTGAEGWEATRTCDADLVVLDVCLPGELDGLSLTRRLRADPLCRDLPIVLLTARAHQDDLSAGRAAGADAYVVKPFRPDRLLGLVSSLTDGAPVG